MLNRTMTRPHPYPFGLQRQQGVAGSIPAPANFALYAPDERRWNVHVLRPDGRRTVHPLRNQQHGVQYDIIPDIVDGTKYLVAAEGTTQLLLDPYADSVVSIQGKFWGQYVDHAFNWGQDTLPSTPRRETIIYEAHVKGLTIQHPEIPEELRGTYAGLAHPVMIDHYLELGITAVQLLPVQHFIDEPHLAANNLTNYWGYNTLNYFSPHPHYATKPAQKVGPSAIAAEFKDMVRRLHLAGIEIYLDVVYNHTAEGGPQQDTYSWRGIAENQYYLTDQHNHYIDYTGCGNTVNYGNPRVVQWTMDSLRHWVQEYHIDGFRFDLAVSMGRGTDHSFSPQHPFFVALSQDPVLAGIKLIAEPWDLGPGGWQTGNFPPGWSDWNDHFRNTMRDFWVADRGRIDSGASGGDLGKVAQALTGSQDLFSQSLRGPFSSINFVTAHDGFTLNDLVSYSYKHNELNRENNRDGDDYSRSYNHGVEGPSDDPDVWGQRLKAAKNLVSSLLIAQGIPMISAGDEVLRTQRGNNNAYCQDNEISWYSWDELTDQQKQMKDYVIQLVKIRKAFLTGANKPDPGQPWPQIERHWFNADGEAMEQNDWWDTTKRTFQMLMQGENYGTGLIIFNGSNERQTVKVPNLNGNKAASYTLEISSSKHGQQRRGAVITAGETETIEPFSTAIFVS